VGGRRPEIVFAIVSTGVLLAALDQFIVNVALEPIGRSLDGDVASLSWVLNAYSIVFAALLVPAGRLADRRGLRAGFIFGAALFTLASALCAAADTLGQLVAARVVQAAGAATVVPSSLGLLLAAYPPERRAGAVRAWSAVLGAAAALGPPLGGLLASASWRWIFVINLPFGIAAIVAGRLLLPRIPGERGPLPDLFGAAMLALAIGSLSLGLVRGEHWGWTSPQVLASFIAAVVFAVAFLRRSARHPSPIVELSLMRVRAFGTSVVATTIYSAAFASMLLSITLWAETGWHWSALHVGVLFAPSPLMVIVMSALGGRVIARLGAGATAALGCCIFAVGATSWAVLLETEANYATGLLPGALLTGAGVGLTLPTLIATGTSALPPERFATGSGVLNMARQVGFVLGVAELVAVVGTDATLDAFRHQWLASTGFALLAAVAAMRLVRSGGAPVATEETALGEAGI
jgi:EmrB/QacA subfamily drug resistance transporter